MAEGQARGDRKRETVSAFAWLLESVILPHIFARRRVGSFADFLQPGRPTILDAGCSTGSLLLPLAHAFPQCEFVAVEYALIRSALVCHMVIVFMCLRTVRPHMCVRICAFACRFPVAILLVVRKYKVEYDMASNCWISLHRH